MKSILHFSPIATKAPEESERYYTSVHVPMARRVFSRHAPGLERYVPQRVLARYDISGGFAGPIDVWRFIVIHHDDPYYLPAEISPSIWRDHVNCIEDIHSYPVDSEEILVDRLTGQTSTAKFILSVRTGDRGASAELRDLLGAGLADVPGGRLLIANAITQMRSTRPVERPGQAMTGELERADISTVFEIYFDNPACGREYFAQDDLRAAVYVRPEAAIQLHEVREEPGVDRR